MTHLAPAPFGEDLPSGFYDVAKMSEIYKKIAYWERPSYFTRFVWDEGKVLVFYYGNYLGTLKHPQELWNLVKAGYSEVALQAWREAHEHKFGLGRPRITNTALPPELERISKAREENARWRREQKAKAKEGKTITLDDLEIKI